MSKTHPHAGASYRLLSVDGAVSVEVAIPDTSPTTISGFADEASAEAWIARHRAEIEAGAPPRRRYGNRL
ncbi:MAG: hypothetical protein JO038_08905 [Alphaproteobacteria bacterium]|nr:hypothetical protein [Alphaproteobacteria bacterium]